MKDTNEIYQIIFQAVLTGNIQETARAASEILDCPVIITDPSYVKLTEVYPPVPQNDPKWDEYIGSEGLSMDAIRQFLNYDYIDRMQIPHQPLLMNRGYFADSPRLTCPITDNGRLIGYISALTSDNRITKEQKSALNIISDGIALCLRSQQHKASGKSNIRNIFTQDLLDGIKIRPSAISEWESMLQMQLKPDFQILYLSHSSSKNIRNGYFNHYLEIELQQTIPNLLTCQKGDSLYAILCGLQTTPDPQADCSFIQIKKNSKAVYLSDHSNLRALFRQFRYRCGVSDVFHNLEDVPRFRIQAEAALETGSRHQPNEIIFHYETYFLEAILDSACEKLGAENCILPAIRVLQKADASSSSEYLQTLRCYLDCSCHSSAACEVLHIHRNTLNYRLHKIETLTGLDLNDAGTRISFSVGLLVNDRYGYETK